MNLLLEIAKNLKGCGEEFSSFHLADAEDTADLKVFMEKMKEYEVKGDTFVHELIVELNHAFITAIDHEDILLLAENMDEVVDGMEECAAYFYMYDLHKNDPYILEFQKQVGKCASELYVAIELLTKKKMQDIKEHTVNVKSYEEAGDITERKAIRKLFEEYKNNPIKIIKYKDLYKLLECTVDSCQAVAKVLDMTVMKNV